MVISNTPYEHGAEATRIGMTAYATRLDRSNPLRLAVLGAGRMGRRHIAAAARGKGVVLAAVCDPVPGAAAAAAPAGTATAAGLGELGRPVDAVVIAAPTPFHTGLAEAALGMGLDVLCEKPVGFDADAIERLGELAARAGRVLAVGFWRRTAWPYSEARRLLDEGAIGVPAHIRAAQWDAELPPLAFADPAVSGGIEVDCGVHEVDLARWFLGAEIAQVSATGTPGTLSEVGDAETVAALAATTAGQSVTIDLGRTCGYDDDVRTEILGSEGALLIDARGSGGLRLGTRDGLREVPGPGGDVLELALAAQLERFAEACAGGEPHATAADAARALEVCQAMRRSRLAGGRVELLTPPHATTS
jgi:myo-inositol 2-dehydrogenase / D-chiro-inositol 1-dehydrogenase